MVSIEDIPMEKRWEIAAKSASAMPFIYDMHFRKALGEKYDEIERKIWKEMGKESKNFAKAFGLPSNNAKQVSDILRISGAILFGPELRFEMEEETEDRAVGRVVECPMLNRAREMGLDPEIVVLPACMNYHKSAVESLNPGYTHKLNANMCSGAGYCEMVIEPKIRQV